MKGCPDIKTPEPPANLCLEKMPGETGLSYLRNALHTREKASIQHSVRLSQPSMYRTFLLVERKLNKVHGRSRRIGQLVFARVSITTTILIALL